MTTKKSLGLAIRIIRKAKKITQEDFSEISSRTYISTLERGLNSPTLDKINEIASVIGIHPLTLLAYSYLLDQKEQNPTQLLELITLELNQFLPN